MKLGAIYGHLANFIFHKQDPSFARLPFWVKFLTSFNHLMAVANSSTNLALFSVIGTQFRATLLAILHLRKPPHRHTRYCLLPIDYVQGSVKRWAPGCVNAEGKARQKW